ncbi:MAG: hypothetical protein J6J87_10490, partial [Oscillospiraceae bacterium]|nr:hypothetical protein [Oscillospiraceae bacterium]
LEVEREMTEKEIGRTMLALFEGLHGREFFSPIVENEAVRTLQLIQNVLNDEGKSDFECVEEIVAILWDAGISTDRHDFD